MVDSCLVFSLFECSCVLFVCFFLYVNFVLLRYLFGPMPHRPGEARRETYPKTYLGPLGCLFNVGICDREMGENLMLSTSCTVEKVGTGDMIVKWDRQYKEPMQPPAVTVMFGSRLLPRTVSGSVTLLHHGSVLVTMVSGATKAI